MPTSMLVSSCRYLSLLLFLEGFLLLSKFLSIFCLELKYPLYKVFRFLYTESICYELLTSVPSAIILDDLVLPLFFYLSLSAFIFSYNL